VVIASRQKLELECALTPQVLAASSQWQHFLVNPAAAALYVFNSWYQVSVASAAPMRRAALTRRPLLWGCVSVSDTANFFWHHLHNVMCIHAACVHGRAEVRSHGRTETQTRARMHACTHARMLTPSRSIHVRVLVDVGICAGVRAPLRPLGAK